MNRQFPDKVPHGTNALLALSNGRFFWGFGLGAEGETSGEVCFNTSMSGYQEILTDPSYAGQIITFTSPHIGNVGTNPEDIETRTPASRGLILREAITEPSNWRANQHFNDWLKTHNLTGICGIDTRDLTRDIRDNGAPNGIIAYNAAGKFDLPALQDKAAALPGLEGMDLAKTVSTQTPYDWTQTPWVPGQGYGTMNAPDYHVVAIDYGAKLNILRELAGLGCKVTVVPCDMPAQDILNLNPDGIFLSNGPGDPAATGRYAVPIVQDLLKSGLPLFGICLGHQILALALGGKTMKMHLGHRGANHPVKNMDTGLVEITSQNHGFKVDPTTLPDNVDITHISLFDGSNEGLRVQGKPVFSVQHHPEASPGPQDAHYLFQQFIDMMADHKTQRKAA